MPYNYGNGIGMCRGNQNRNTGRYTETLFGQSIHDNPVPVWTADRAHSPFVDFQDTQNGSIIGLSKQKLSYGFLTIAEPGGGKTNLLNMITARLLETQQENDTLIIFDTKGDYFREFGSRIPENERIIIGTGEEYRDISGIPNIFAEIMPRGADGKLVYSNDTDADALQLAKQLFQNMNSELQPVFPAMAEQIVAGCLIYFARSYWRCSQEKLNNQDFIEFMCSSTNEELKAVFELDSMKDYRNCISYISGKSNQTQGVNSYIGTVLRELFIGPFAQHDPRREFSMREVVCNPGRKTVFIEYDLRRGDALAPMYGLLADSGLRNALGGHQTDRNHVYFIFDEMLLLPKLQHLSNGLNFGRSQGVKVLCGLQNVSGLVDRYGQTGANSILASFQNIVAFRNSDSETRLFLMERMGRNYQNTSFSAQQENVHIQREGYTVEDWDILSLKMGQAIVSLKDESPFFFNIPKYQ